ncbi:glycoside hydrolase family 97 protein [Parabacteroides chinchillae]
MNVNVKALLFFCVLLGSMPAMAQKNYNLQSPDKVLQAQITVGDDIQFSLTHDGTEVLAPSTISMTLQDGEVLGAKPKVSKVVKASVDKEILSPFYKKSVVKDEYNEATISFAGNYSIVFRLYNEGLAYRFVTKKKGDIIVVGEEAEYNFSKDHKAFAAYVNNKAETFEKQYFNSFEQPYVNESITKLNNQRLMILPFLVELDNGKKVCITEADLEEFPGMFLNNSADKPCLKAIHAPFPKIEEQGGHNRLQMLVKERENFIAKTKGTRSFPWRVFTVSTDDKELADCDMVYRLASPSKVSDISWIKPGKVAWDWWNDWNLYGVDFRAGINNETYKYYIDFASAHGIEYVILDEGWAVNLQADMLQVIPEINLQELVNYGKAKNVGIILWAGYWAFARDMENVVKHYADMGVKGFKIDFLDRDDQKMVEFVYKAAKVCAENKMLVDFHGVFKPTGLQRTYPNVLNYEGVNGLEQLKWSPESYDMVTYDVTIPYIRMMAGPMDYTQGAMRNASRWNYRPVNSEPMSQGTRCRQLATYVIFESPFNMLCDNPSNYMREKECTEFIANVPTVWDETVSLDGKVAEYIAMARKHGDDWYVGALTNWEPRELTLDLSFLGEGNYKIELFKDGINADRAACDYKKEILSVPADRKLNIKMAPGGGYVARIYK